MWPHLQNYKCNKEWFRVSLWRQIKVTVGTPAHLFLRVTILWVSVLAFSVICGLFCRCCDVSPAGNTVQHGLDCLNLAGFSAESLPPCISMHFTTQAHRYPLRTLMLIQFSALFNIFSLCRFFFSFFPSLVHGVWVCQPLPTGLLAGTYISLFHLPRVDSRAKRFSCPWDHCLIKNIACHN